MKSFNRWLLGLLMVLALLLPGCAEILDELTPVATLTAEPQQQGNTTPSPTNVTSAETDPTPVPSALPEESKDPQSDDIVLTSFEEVAAFLFEHGALPDNYLTKAEARKLGWDAQKRNLAEVAPGKSIGGDLFHNREGKLPKKTDRKWYEADIDYEGGGRNAKRLLYSSDGLVFKTEDHYNTFTEIKQGDQ